MPPKVPQVKGVRALVKSTVPPVQAPQEASQPEDPSLASGEVGLKVFSKVVSYLDQRQLGFLDKPGAKTGKWSDIPEDPTTLASAELWRLQTGLTRWLSYANSELARCKIKIIDLESGMKKRKAALLIEHMGMSSKSKKYELDAEVMVDEQYAELETQLTMERAKEVGLQAAFDRYDRICASLSRELTRRGQELEKMGRGEV